MLYTEQILAARSFDLQTKCPSEYLAENSERAGFPLPGKLQCSAHGWGGLHQALSFQEYFIATSQVVAYHMLPPRPRSTRL